MTVTITPEVTTNASMAAQACEAAERFTRDFNNTIDKEARRSADALGVETWSDQWYAEYNRVYKPLGANRDAYVDQQMVLNGWAGWTIVGSGAFRTAMLGPDGLVYKVGCSEDNKMEATISEHLHKVIDSCPTKAFRILDMKIVGEILVTEYTPKVADSAPCEYAADHPDWHTFTRWVSQNECGVMDTHEYNIWWDGSAFAVIDMGNWSFKRGTKWR